VTLQETLQILGGIGVIASMIYVGIQIRNNARAMRAATYQQLSALTMQGWMALTLNGETTEIILRGLDDFHSLSRVEKARFRFNLMVHAKGYENAWFQRKIGTLHESDWKAITSDLSSFFSTPGARTAWPMVKNRFNSELVAFLDQIVEQQAAAAAANNKPPQIVATKTEPRKTKSTKA
jgi:hypothetical protein